MTLVRVARYGATVPLSALRVDPGSASRDRPLFVADLELDENGSGSATTCWPRCQRTRDGRSARRRCKAVKVLDCGRAARTMPCTSRWPQKPATSGEGAASHPRALATPRPRMRRASSTRRAGIDTWTLGHQRSPMTIRRRNTARSNPCPTNRARAGAAPADGPATSTTMPGPTRRPCPSAASRTTSRRTACASTTSSRGLRPASWAISASVSIGRDARRGEGPGRYLRASVVAT